MTESQVACLRGVTKTYGGGENRVEALRGIDLDIHPREFSAIMGPSGSGKSTLLHMLAGLDAVTSGQIIFGNIDITKLNDRDLTNWRRDHIGFVFQSFNLIPTLDARANIELPLNLAGERLDEEWFNKVVTELGLSNRLTHKPWELSGGQVQRVAVARALVKRPEILAADEPTGNLDTTSGGEVLALLRQAVDEFGQTVVMVTHDRHAAAIADRVLVVRDGKITHDLIHPSATEIAEVA